MPGTSESKGRTSRKSGTSSQPQTGRKSRTQGTQAGDSHTLIVREKAVQVGTYPEPVDAMSKGQQVASSKGAFPSLQHTSGEVYLFIRGKKEYVTRLKNAFVRDKRVVEGYQGRYVGMSDEICRFEGDLYRGLPEQCFIIIRFGNMLKCDQWVHSSNHFKQKDFPGPADELEMFAVPLNYIPEEDLVACQLTEMHCMCVDGKTFEKNYVKPVTSLLNAKKIHHGVVATGSVNRIRNCRIRPHTFVLLNCAKDEKTLKDFYDSPEYASLKEYRLQAAENDTCFFKIRPVTD